MKFYSVVGSAVLFVSIATNLAAAPNRFITTIAVNFSSAGKTIRVNYYAPTNSVTPKRGPVLLLHGAGGILFDGPDIRRLARQLAADGHPVYIVHYFNRTGTLVGLDAAMQRNFDIWLATVRDAIDWVAVRENKADHSHAAIGVYGYSLGAFLALAASSDNPSVGAVVEQSGGLWNGRESRVRHLPATLVIHGNLDRRVPFPKYAEPLVRLLRRRGIIFETEFFPAEGHRFSKEALTQIRNRTVDFFHRKLAPP